MLPSSKKPSCLLPAFCLGQHFLEVLGVEKWELLWLGRAAWRSELPFTPVNLGSVFLTPAFAIATFVRIFDRRRVTSRLQIFQQKYQKAAGSLFFSWREGHQDQQHQSVTAAQAFRRICSAIPPALVSSAL